ncbi:MAG TPA: hypothetical protein VFU19_16485 [Iamia sp.]|nr:hypothetical protein [Iamia sp.]
MRRGCRCLLTLILAIGALAACGDDSGSSSAPTTTASTTTEAGFPDPGAAVPEFCTKSAELQAINEAPRPTTPEQGVRTQQLVTELDLMSGAFERQAGEMLPGEVARYRQCSASAELESHRR